MQVAVENLQRALQLLSSPDDVWIQSARTYVLEACAMLGQHSAGPEMRVSAIELLLKAELALASVPSSVGDLRFRLADQLLLEARARLAALDSDEKG